MTQFNVLTHLNSLPNLDRIPANVTGFESPGILEQKYKDVIGLTQQGIDYWFGQFRDNIQKSPDGDQSLTLYSPHVGYDGKESFTRLDYARRFDEGGSRTTDIIYSPEGGVEKAFQLIEPHEGDPFLRACKKNADGKLATSEITPDNPFDDNTISELTFWGIVHAKDALNPNLTDKEPQKIRGLSKFIKILFPIGKK